MSSIIYAPKSRCDACNGTEKFVRFHTCHGDLAVVKDAMLAAGELGQRFRFYTRVGGHQWDRAGYEAEVERLFEGGKK